MYSLEMVELTKIHEDKLEMAELKIPRFVLGVIQMHRVRVRTSEIQLRLSAFET